MSKDFSGWYTVTPSGKVKCKACTSEFANRKGRMLSHLGYAGKNGTRDTGISLCSRLTSAIQALFLRCDGVFPRRSDLENIDGQTLAIVANTMPADRDFDRSTQEDSCTAPIETVHSASGINQNTESTSQQGTPPCSMTRPRRQSQLIDGFEEAGRRNLNTLWANFFYSANIPFAVARSEVFKEAVKKTAEFKRPYSPPSYGALRTKLLDQARADLEVKVHKRTEESIRKFGATLSMDGWSSVTNQPLLNVMLVSSAGEQFLGSVDTSGFEKTGEYLATVLDGFLQKVGPENVVQITADNATVNPKAVGIVTKKYPHIFFQGCVAHALNLLLKDWRKEKWITTLVHEARMVLKFFRKRHMPLALFRTYEKELSLLMPGETRFASNFIALERLMKVKGALKQCVNDPRWNTYVRTLSDRNGNSRTKSRLVKKIIEGSEFWRTCKNFVQLVGPVVYGLRDVDAKTPCTGKVLQIMRKIRKHMVALVNPPFRFNDEEVKPLRAAFQARWKLVENDLMYAAALLNPYLLEDQELANDGYATTACKNVFKQICKPEEYHDVVKEFMAFRHKEFPFHNMADAQESKLSAHAWWDFEGACAKLLAPIARRILGQPVSSSACERNWSSYSFVHNKSRNKLKTKRAMDLVYVYTNSRVLSTSKERDEKEWYRENVQLDSEESDGPIGEDDSSDDDNDFLEDIHPNYVNDEEDEDMEQSEDEQGIPDVDLFEDTWLDRSGPLLNSNVGRLHMSNDNVINNNRDEYDYPEDDGHCESDEDVPSIAKFLDGSGLLNTESLLENKEDKIVVPTTAVEITVAARMSESGVVLGPERSPLVAHLENKDNLNDEGQVNVDNTTLEFGERTTSNHTGDQSIVDPTTQLPVIDVPSQLVESGSPNRLHNGEDMRESTEQSPRVNHSTPAQVMVNTRSTALLGSRSSDLEMQTSNISSSPTPEDNETLHAALKKRQGCPLPSSMKPSNGKLKSLTEIEGCSNEGQQTGKAMLEDRTGAKKRRVMEPFEISPRKKARTGKPPLDRRERNAVDGLRQSIGKTLMQVKKEKMAKSKRRKVLPNKGESQLSSSDDEEDTFNSEDDGLQSNDCSSGAEVKGDKDYKPRIPNRRKDSNEG